MEHKVSHHFWNSSGLFVKSHEHDFNSFNSCNCRLKPSTCLACETRRCRRRLCRVDCHDMINQMRLAMTTVRSPSPTVATAASREQTLSRVYCNVRLPWQPACSPLPKQRRNENILLSSHPSPTHLF